MLLLISIDVSIRLNERSFNQFRDTHKNWALGPWILSLDTSIGEQKWKRMDYYVILSTTSTNWWIHSHFIFISAHYSENDHPSGNSCYRKYFKNYAFCYSKITLSNYRRCVLEQKFTQEIDTFHWLSSTFWFLQVQKIFLKELNMTELISICNYLGLDCSGTAPYLKNILKPRTCGHF